MVEKQNIQFRCLKCKNFIHKNSFSPIFKCKAFIVIPDEIVSGENYHAEPLKGQGNDIVFEPIDEKK